MATNKVVKTNHKITIIKIPLSSLRCISSYPKEQKVLCEINTKELKKLNKPKTLDEIINLSRLDYALGKYKTFTNAKDLIKELRT